jgi:hypothetical protein
MKWSNMNIRDNIERGLYTYDGNYPHFVKKCPECDKPYNKKDFYCSLCGSYLKHKERYSKYMKELSEYRMLQSDLEAKFKRDLEREFGLEHHSKKDLLYEKAWNLGHSCGLNEVYSYYEDLVDLIL